jgi:hypothetical protein
MLVRHTLLLPLTIPVKGGGWRANSRKNRLAGLYPCPSIHTVKERIHNSRKPLCGAANPILQGLFLSFWQIKFQGKA